MDLERTDLCVFVSVTLVITCNASRYCCISYAIQNYALAENQLYKEMH